MLSLPLTSRSQSRDERLPDDYQAASSCDAVVPGRKTRRHRNDRCRLAPLWAWVDSSRRQLSTAGGRAEVNFRPHAYRGWGPEGIPGLRRREDRSAPVDRPGRPRDAEFFLAFTMNGKQPFSRVGAPRAVGSNVACIMGRTRLRCRPAPSLALGIVTQRSGPRSARRWLRDTLLALALWVGLAPAALAQTPSAGADFAPPWPRGFGYGVTLSAVQSRDDLLAPLRWRGTGFGLRASWDWGGNDRRHVAALGIPIAILSNRFGHRGYAFSPALTYGFLTRVVRNEDTAAGWLGGRMRLDMFNAFYESWDDEHLYWITAYSLGPTSAWRGRFRGTPAWAPLDIPLLAAVARPPEPRLNQIDRLTKLSGHLVDPHKNARVAAFPDYAAVHASVGLVLRAGGSSFTVSYMLDWSRYALPARVAVLSQSVSISRGPAT